MKAAEIVGWNLRRLRVANKLSQEVLAVDAGVDVSYLSRLESGLENPTIGLLEKLLKVLDADISDLTRKPKPGDKRPETLPKGRKKKI